MTIYRSVNGVNREITEQYIGVNSVNREIISQHRGVLGVNRSVFDKKQNPGQYVLYQAGVSSSSVINTLQEVNTGWTFTNPDISDTRTRLSTSGVTSTCGIYFPLNVSGISNFKIEATTNFDNTSSDINFRIYISPTLTNVFQNYQESSSIILSSGIRNEFTWNRSSNPIATGLNYVCLVVYANGSSNYASNIFKISYTIN